LLPPSTRNQTPVVKKSLNPSYPADGATFDYPIYLSLAGVVGARGLEAVVWDKVSSLPPFSQAPLIIRIYSGKSIWEKPLSHSSTGSRQVKLNYGLTIFLYVSISVYSRSGFG
jgi:hypothetical protein